MSRKHKAVSINTRIVLAVAAAAMLGCAVKATPYLWRSEFTASGPVTGYHAQVNALGEIYDTGYAGESRLRKLSAQGSELWNVPVTPGRMVVYGEDGVILAGHPLQRIDADGAEVWSRDVLPAGTLLGDIVAAQNGNLYLSYYSYGYPAGYGNTGVIALDAAGNELWSYEFAHADDGNRMAIGGLAVLASGDLLSVLGGDGQVEIHRFDPVGNLADARKIEAENLHGASVQQQADNVFVTGQNRVMRLNTDGSVAWTYEFPANVNCSEPAGTEIACMYKVSNLSDSASNVSWLTAAGTLRTSVTVNTGTPKALVYAGASRWVLSEFVTPPHIANGSNPPPLGYPDGDLYANTPGQAYARLNVLDANGAVIDKIIMTPSRMTPSNCYGSFCYNMDYASDGDGPVSVLASAQQIYAYGSTTLTQKAFVSAYSRK